MATAVRGHDRTGPGAWGEERVTISGLPAAAQATIADRIGRDDRRYHATTAAGGVKVENPAHGLAVDFARGSVSVTHAGERLGFTLEGVGYGEALEPVEAVTPTATANRVEYRRGALTEWYVNGPLGLEQGFTLARPPAPSDVEGPLTVALRVSSTLRAAVTPSPFTRLGANP
ncbi:MAG: hypothetical protein GEV06_29070, partial [Luteitalea sp.]|nr:hypothetical protein [Luteitalea sp.]